MERKHNADLTQNARNLRKNMTKEERHLWYDFLRDYSVRFLRQKVIDNYVVDFYCHKAKIAVEIDGSQHFSDEGMLKDIFRTEILEEIGLKVIRFTNKQVNENFQGVCEYIDQQVKASILEGGGTVEP